VKITIVLSAFLFSVPAALAEEGASQRIQFERGASQATVSGKLSGREDVVYKLNARDGQFLQVRMLPGVKGADFNIYIPGRGPGEEALYSSSTGGREYLGQLYKTGEHSIMVFQNRAAARRGDATEYKMLVRVTDEKPAEEEVPAEGEVPERVIADCFAALRKQVPDREMKVIRAVRGETSFIIDFEVEGVPKPWRVFHSGSEVTGTEYQGEG